MAMIHHLSIIPYYWGVRFVLGIIFSLFISIGLPLVALFYAIIRKRHMPFLLGMLAFISSQVFIRIPLLEYMQVHSTTYLMFSAMQPVLFAVVIGLSAGVFEEMARFIIMRFFMKQRNWQSGFLFGAGHGGIEAVLFRSEEHTSELQSRGHLVCRP